MFPDRERKNTTDTPTALRWATVNIPFGIKQEILIFRNEGVKAMDKKIEEELEFLRKQIKELNSFNDCLSRAQLTLSRFMMHIDNRIRNIEKKLE